MKTIEKKIIANRIVQSCDFITKDWEFYLMFNALVEALEWGERVNPQAEEEEDIEEGEPV